MGPRSPNVLIFGDHQLDAENRLTRAGRLIPLPPKEGAVLRLLAERQGRTVSKNDLFERVWPGVAPSDESLTRCIYALRHALEDVQKPHSLIETVHARGYRFIGKLLPAADRQHPATWLERASNASPRAYETFMHARAIWHGRSSESITRAVAMLQQVLEWEPRYASAHSALGATYVIMMWWGHGSPRELAPKITAAATRALALEPDIAAGKAVLAYVRSLIDWHPAEADGLFEQAVESDPTSSLARYLHAVHLVGQGRLEETVESASAAIALDPYSLALNNHLAFALYASRRFQDAIESSRRAVELDPSNGPAYGQLALAHDQLGRLDDALAAARKWVALSPNAPGARGGLAHALARNGQRAEAAAILERARRETSVRYIVPCTYAPASCALDDREGAFAWLDLAVEQRCCWLAPLLADPRLDSLRPDARFRRLVAMVRERPEREVSLPMPRISGTTGHRVAR
jgi:DNA-binding winged helix-turn-helix (wHTH) protein/cytochrome c-type biogenesis protein CcmH/NrfG